MQLNNFGKIVLLKWNNIPKHFLNTRLGDFQIMPNHLHGIVFIVGAKHFSEGLSKKINQKEKNASPLHPIGTTPGSLSAIMQNFLSVTTRKINQIRKTPGAKLWQRNYYEHIIRNENELDRIREYILNNPLQWEYDKENPQNWNPKK